MPGWPRFLCPFPDAVDDHQTANALHLQQAGAAKVVQQVDLDAPLLAELLTELNERNTLLDMAGRARQQARPDASDRVAAVSLEVMQ